MINYLARIKQGPFIDKIGIITDEDFYEYIITFNFKSERWFKKFMVEIVSIIPQNNQFNRSRCYWCDINLKKFEQHIPFTTWNIYYCPRCLR